MNRVPLYETGNGVRGMTITGGAAGGCFLCPDFATLHNDLRTTDEPNPMPDKPYLIG